MRPEHGETIDRGMEGVRDVQLEALAHRQRRRLLAFLRTAAPSDRSLEAAVAHLASTSEHDYQRVETTLVHRHLPKLEDADIVTYDPSTDRLTYSGDTVVTAILDLL